MLEGPEGVGLKRRSIPIACFSCPSDCCHTVVIEPPDLRVWFPQRLRVSEIYGVFFHVTFRHEAFRVWGPLAGELARDSALPPFKLLRGTPLRLDFLNYGNSDRPLFAVLDVLEVVD